MKHALVVLALSGCNWVFGLDPTHARPEPDGPPPPMCPAIDAGPPVFGSAATQIKTGCHDLSTTAGPSPIAVLQCGTSGQLFEGPLDTLELQPLAIQIPIGETLDSPRISPDGRELFVVSSSGLPAATVRRYTRAAGQPFVLADTLPISNVRSFDKLSAPTTGAGRRLLVSYTDPAGGPRHVAEYKDTAGTWMLVRDEQATDPAVGLAVWTGAGLTTDGLRSVFAAAKNGAMVELYYRERASIDVAFGPPVSLAPEQTRFSPWLTEDCARVYFDNGADLSYLALASLP